MSAVLNNMFAAQEGYEESSSSYTWRHRRDTSAGRRRTSLSTERTPAFRMNGANCHPKILPLSQMCLRASDPAHGLIYSDECALSRSKEGLDTTRPLHFLS
ncbi:hypothetical protein NPIL_564171 [Nephila pilipes]|uniref:Uncharacterized protein n=1 Tax=Nephila pilipes TaxID=299642 RepID=A0A8X6U4Z2_NEPPI|nr:hypothetical protein NPIL_564171 [Nephila pilipes]